MKKNPEYNSLIMFEFDHKKKYSEIELDCRYGADPKNSNKRLYFFTSLTKKITNYKNMAFVFKAKAQAPEFVSFNTKESRQMV